MARTRVLVTSLVVVVMAGGVAVLGWVVGTAIGEHRQDAKREATQAKLTEYMEEHIQGISEGKSFPELTVWSYDDSSPHTVRELLPQGGVIFLAGADCPSCVETAVELDKVKETLGNSSRPFVFLLDRAEISDSFRELLEARHVTLPMYCDVTEAMRREYRVVSTRAYFRLDAQGIVQEYAPIAESTPELLANIIQN